MNTPSPINFLKEFLDWSATDGRVGEVRHSAMIDQANAAITAFNTAQSPSLESLKMTFEVSLQALRDARQAFGGVVLNEPDLKRIAVLDAVAHRAESEYLIAFYQTQYTQASNRWSEALRNLDTTISVHHEN